MRADKAADGLVQGARKLTGLYRSMESSHRKMAWYGVSLALFGSLIYASGPERFWNALSSAQYIFLIPAVLTGVSTTFIFAFTWYRVLNKMDVNTSYTESIKMYLSGLFLNNITPLGQAGGEPFMAYIVSNKTGESYEKAFSSVMSSDIINIFPPLSFVIGGAAYLALFGSAGSTIIQILYLSATVLFIGTGLGYIIWCRTSAVTKIVDKVGHRLSEFVGRPELSQKITGKTEKLEEALTALGQDKKYLLKTAAVVHLSFVLEVATLFLVLLSLGYQSDLAPLYFILPLSDIGNNAPTPGGAGAYEAAMAASITAFLPLPFETALTAALLYRIPIYWIRTSIGYASFVKMKQ
jgi:hypothetical protein